MSVIHNFALGSISGVQVQGLGLGNISGVEVTLGESPLS